MKGVGKVKKLTTCACEWNVGWFPSISQINSIPEFGFFEVEIIYLLSCNQFEASFSEVSSAYFSLSLALFKSLVLFWFVLSVLSALIFVYIFSCSDKAVNR